MVAYSSCRKRAPAVGAHGHAPLRQNIQDRRSETAGTKINLTHYPDFLSLDKRLKIGYDGMRLPGCRSRSARNTMRQCEWPSQADCGTDQRDAKPARDRLRCQTGSLECCFHVRISGK